MYALGHALSPISLQDYLSFRPRQVVKKTLTDTSVTGGNMSTELPCLAESGRHCCDTDLETRVWW
jgi:hypothetical protein